MRTRPCGNRLVARRRIWSLLIVVTMACPLPAWATATDPRGAIAIGLDGQTVAPLTDADAAAVVLLFTETQCPIANRYSPEIARLIRVWTPRRVRFWFVYPDPATDATAVRAHRRLYALQADALLDPDHALVRAAGATVTPEAAVFVKGELRYNGRIDDRARDFGVFAPVATDRTLDHAIEAVLNGRPVRETPIPGVGCLIADLVRRE